MVISIKETISAEGLRLVIVQGAPSAWGQAAKAMMEYKGVSFSMAYQEPGGKNEELMAWSGTNSGPVVAWDDEAPINRWDDILLLLERIAPNKPLLPTGGKQRALVMGLSHEICGQLGLGWNRRISLFAPAIESQQAPESLLNIAAKYRYDSKELVVNVERQINGLKLLADTLNEQKSNGSDYFVGEKLSAVDFYWAAFCDFFAIRSLEEIPIDLGFHSMFQVIEPEVKAAIEPILLEHRDRMIASHFKVPMEV